MDIKAIIESGILEQFVLGNTSQEETSFIIELSISNPEIKEEIESIENSLIKLAESYETQPKRDLKSDLLARMAVETEAAEKIESPSNEHKLPKAYKNNSIPIYRWMVAASILLFGISLGGNIILYNNLKNAQQSLATLSSGYLMLTENNNIQQSKYEEMNNQMAVLLNPETKPVTLKGMPLMPNALATVYWDSTKKEVYITAQNLPITNTNEQYQLWAIVDGKPVDAGVFETEEALKGLVKMKNAGNVAAFAITIEKKGGSPAPNLDKMVLLGNVI